MTVLYDEKQLFPGESASSGSLLTAPASQTGIGMAPAQPDPVKDAYSKMSGSQEFFTRLAEFGAGVTGQPSPLVAEIETKRKAKLTQLQELKETVSALEHGIEMRKGMSAEDAAAFDEAYGNKLEAIQPGMKQTFTALAKKPDMLTQFKEYAQYLPEPIQVMMKSNSKEFLRFAGTAEGMKVLVDAKDKSDLRLATKKVQTALLGLDQFVPADKLKAIKADNVITASEVLEIQQYLPDQVKLSEAQVDSIKRNDRVFWEGLGVLHGPKEQELLVDRAKRAGRPPDEPKTQTIAGKVYQWDPDKTITGTRLGTDTRYVELGPVKEPGKPGGIDPQIVNVELKVSDDYRQDSKKFSERRPLFESTTDYMANRDKDKTSAGDAALMFAYAKMRDPNDRIAVSDIKDLHKLGNIFERIGVSVAGVLDKGQTIPDRVAQDMYAEIRRNFTELNRAQGKLEKTYRNKIKAYGGDESRVLGEGLHVRDLERRGSAKAALGTVIQRGGKSWKVVGHDKDGEPLVEEVRQ